MKGRVRQEERWQATVRVSSELHSIDQYVEELKAWERVDGATGELELPEKYDHGEIATGQPQVRGFLDRKLNEINGVDKFLIEPSCKPTVENMDDHTKGMILRLKEIDRDLRILSAKKFNEPPCREIADIKKRVECAESRFRGKCLRAIKLAACHRGLRDGQIANYQDNTCKAEGHLYTEGEHAKEHPLKLISQSRKPGMKKWLNIKCDTSMTPETAPIGSILCYDAIDATLPTDKTAKHGHCEVKVSSCQYCFDGCATRPRTGGGPSGKNRFLTAVMISDSRLGTLPGTKTCDVRAGTTPGPLTVQPIKATAPALKLPVVPGPVTRHPTDAERRRVKEIIDATKYDDDIK